MKFEIDEKLANTILTYLGTRPYLEVYKLIEEFKTIKPIKDNVEIAIPTEIK